MPWCDLHYDVDDCVPPAPPPPPPIPQSVFVAICVYTIAVASNTSMLPATQPITGKMGIFQRPQVTMEERLGVEIVAVTITRQEAERAVTTHRQARNAEGINYEITEQPLGLKQSVQESAPPVTDHPCILCGTPGQPLNRSFCDTCERRRNEALRVRDQDLINASQR